MFGDSAALAKRITSDSVITPVGVAGVLWGVTLTAAAADATLDIKNGTTGGTILWSLHVKAAEGANSIAFAKPIVFDEDIFADLTGAGAIASFAYEELE